METSSTDVRWWFIVARAKRKALATAFTQAPTAAAALADTRDSLASAAGLPITLLELSAVPLDTSVQLIPAIN